MMSLEKVCPLKLAYFWHLITASNITYNWLMRIAEEMSKGYRIAIFLLETVFAGLSVHALVKWSNPSFVGDVHKGWNIPVN